MGFDQLVMNYRIHRLLRRLAKQRVSTILQPGNVWVIEDAVPNSEENSALLCTCLLRGWVEILHDSVPTGSLNSDGSFPPGELFKNEEPIWRLTDSGWAVIYRSHLLAILGIFLSILGLIITI